MSMTSVLSGQPTKLSRLPRSQSIDEEDTKAEEESSKSQQGGGALSISKSLKSLGTIRGSIARVMSWKRSTKTPPTPSPALTVALPVTETAATTASHTQSSAATRLSPDSFLRGAGGVSNPSPRAHIDRQSSSRSNAGAATSASSSRPASPRRGSPDREAPHVPEGDTHAQRDAHTHTHSHAADWRGRGGSRGSRSGSGASQDGGGAGGGGSDVSGDSTSWRDNSEASFIFGGGELKPLPTLPRFSLVLCLFLFLSLSLPLSLSLSFSEAAS